MGWLHSGQSGASLVMRRTLMERPLRPEVARAARWSCAAVSVTSAGGPLTLAHGYSRLCVVVITKSDTQCAVHVELRRKLYKPRSASYRSS